MPTNSADLDDTSTVLVTGASGFLGSRVVMQLSELNGPRVMALDIVDGDPKGLGALPRVTVRTADLCNADALAEACEGVTHIAHLAAMRSKASQTGIRAALDVNVGSTYDLMAVAAKNDLRAFVYGSSHLIYGAFPDADRPLFTEAEAAVRPGLSLYAAAKLASEAFVGAFSEAFGIDFLCLRFGGIYGPDAAPGSNSGAMVDALAAVDRGDAPAVSWSRETVHSLIYVDDAARAVVRALSLPIRNCAVNVVDEPRRCELIYSELLRLYGADPASMVYQDDRSRYQLVSGERLRKELGATPQVSLELGLDQIIAWHRARA